MLPPWVKPAGFVVGAVALVLAGRWSSSPDRWQAKLDSTATALHARITADSQAYQLRHATDSAAMADVTAKLLAATEARDAATRSANALAPLKEQARRVLAAARTKDDSLAAYKGLTAAQEHQIVGLVAVIVADSGVVTGLRTQLGISQRQTASEAARAIAAETKLAELLGVVDRRPKGFTLFGLHLELKPYLGVGATVTMQGKGYAGVQVGLSILRG